MLFDKIRLIGLGVAVAVCALAIVETQSRDRVAFADAGKEAKEKSRIMKSPRWLKARHAFDEWLSIQKLYNEEEIADLKLDLERRIAVMSAADLKHFLDEMEEKLQILLSDEVADARRWVGQYVSVLATHRREEFRKQLPDVRKMSSTQMHDYLREYRSGREQEAQHQAMSNRMRQQQVAEAMAENRHRHAAFEKARQQQQHAVASQASKRFSNANQQSMKNAQHNTWQKKRTPAYRPHYNHGGYRW